MKLFRDKEIFTVQTQLDSDGVLDKLGAFVDFKHKGTISTIQISKEYYGNIENESSVKIWKAPLISGLFDKGFAPTIGININEGKVEVSIEDNFFIMFMVLVGILLISASIFVYGAVVHSYYHELIYFGLPLVCMPLIGFAMERIVFLRTIKDIRKRLEILEK